MCTSRDRRASVDDDSATTAASRTRARWRAWELHCGVGRPGFASSWYEGLGIGAVAVGRGGGRGVDTASRCPLGRRPRPRPLDPPRGCGRRSPSTAMASSSRSRCRVARGRRRAGHGAVIHSDGVTPHEALRPAGADERVHLAPHGVSCDRDDLGAAPRRRPSTHESGRSSLDARGARSSAAAIDVHAAAPFEQALVVLDSAARTLVDRRPGRRPRPGVMRRPGERHADRAAGAAAVARLRHCRPARRGHRGSRYGWRFAVRRSLLGVAVREPHPCAVHCRRSAHRRVGRSSPRSIRLSVLRGLPVAAVPGLIGEADGWSKYPKGIATRDALRQAERDATARPRGGRVDRGQVGSVRPPVRRRRAGDGGTGLTRCCVLTGTSPDFRHLAHRAEFSHPSPRVPRG